VSIIVYEGQAWGDSPSQSPDHLIRSMLHDHRGLLSFAQDASTGLAIRGSPLELFAKLHTSCSTPHQRRGEGHCHY